MKYEYGLVLRILLSFIPVSAFLFLFSSITIYGVYFSLFFYNPIAEGINLTISNEVFSFVEACIAPLAYMLLWLLIMWTKDINLFTRAKMFLFGSLLIYLMNVVRIFILIMVSLNYGVNWFERIHILFWDFTASVFVALVWIFLIKFYKIKDIPVYSDIKYLYKKSVFKN